MTLDRKNMERALKSIVVPRIRSLHFAGAFPYFRRKIGTEYQMLMIMFNKYGGSFYLEAGRISQESFQELQTFWAKAGKSLEASSLNVGHCKWNERSRLGPKGDVPNADLWFKFGPENGDPGAPLKQPAERFNKISEHVAHVIDTRVEAYFACGT